MFHVKREDMVFFSLDHILGVTPKDNIIFSQYRKFSYRDMLIFHTFRDYIKPYLMTLDPCYKIAKINSAITILKELGYTNGDIELILPQPGNREPAIITTKLAEYVVLVAPVITSGLKQGEDYY
ncbi:MAG: hypothetical protein ACP6IU_13060 [Candidatus Asgardarchaeia archaeon]